MYLKVVSADDACTGWCGSTKITKDSRICKLGLSANRPKAGVVAYLPYKKRSQVTQNLGWDRILSAPADARGASGACARAEGSLEVALKERPKSKSATLRQIPQRNFRWTLATLHKV